MKDNFQLFDDYLFENMTRVERQAFEEKLKEDPDFKREFEVYCDLIAGIREEGRGELRTRIRKAFGTGPASKKKKMSSSNSLKKIGALLTFMMICLSGYLGFFHRPSAGYLFDKYYVPYLLHGTVRGTNIEENSLLLFYRAYRQGLYEEAGLLVYQALDDLPLNKPHVLLAYGCTMMSTGDYLTALELFRLPAVAGNGFTSDQSNWYQALCLLQLDQPEACASLLSPLAENADADHHVEARKLLRSLRRLNRKTK